jgi:GNAT superfamily N-acetyltransferase
VTLAVGPERGRRDRRAFLDLPYRLNAGAAAWVPPLRMADRVRTDRAKNPFFRHADAAHFLARRDGRVVGRVAAIENRLHNEVHGDRVGFFGFFDVEDDAEAAKALVAEARSWARSRGLASLRGPVSYSTNDPVGVLVEGFDEPPTLEMPWNRPHYDAHLRSAGLAPAKDLLSYVVRSADGAPERFRRIAIRALERGGITLRQLEPRRWASEIALVRDLYNRSWERNWGFVPMTEAEFAHAAKDLKFLVDPRVFLIAERRGTPVGFVGLVPNVNECLVGLDGRLVSFGFLPVGLLRLLARKRRIRSVRVMLLGVVPEARGAGIDAGFFVEAYRRCALAGYDWGEAGWILEDNARMRADLENAGGRVRCRYRVYEAPV